MMHNRGFWLGHGGFYGFDLFQLIFMIGVLLIVAAIVIYVMKHKKSNDAVEILKQQFASGQITEEDYLNRKEILEKK